MPRTLQRPDGLAEEAWASIVGCLDRLERAERDHDSSLMIGQAKELIEATARVVLAERGETVASNEDYQQVLNRAHVALERQPGPELAADSTIRNIAQGAKLIATQLRDLRNRYGTGHGRASLPHVPEELVVVSVDAALLWSQWALRRLHHYISGRPWTLARDLRENVVFYAGTLRRRLQEAGLPSLPPADQHLLGVAVAHRARENTFVVVEDGLDACAENPDLEAWPEGYRAGLAEGLFLDRWGYLDATPHGVERAAAALKPHPRSAEVLSELNEKLRDAGLSNRLRNSRPSQDQVVAAMEDAALGFPPGAATEAWMGIAENLRSPSPEADT